MAKEVLTKEEVIKTQVQETITGNAIKKKRQATKVLLQAGLDVVVRPEKVLVG